MKNVYLEQGDACRILGLFGGRVIRVNATFMYEFSENDEVRCLVKLNGCNPFNGQQNTVISVAADTIKHK